MCNSSKPKPSAAGDRFIRVFKVDYFSVRDNAAKPVTTMNQAPPSSRLAHCRPLSQPHRPSSLLFSMDAGNSTMGDGDTGSPEMKEAED
jgi:hypothetical protein